MLNPKKKDWAEYDEFSDAFYQFDNYLRKNLRVNDIILHGHHNTIFLMLADIPGEDMRTFLNKVMQEWETKDASKVLDITSYFDKQ